MAYDESFYDLYDAYLAEPRVRAVHGQAFAALAGGHEFGRVLDLGCGRVGEFFRFGAPWDGARGLAADPAGWSCVGIDANARPRVDGRAEFIDGDYRAGGGDLPVRLAVERGLTGAVSLFSTECTAPEAENRVLYERLLTETPIKRLLVAGFYYAHAAGRETVEEVGGLVSWQTVAPLESCVSDAYLETRLAIPCPSTLFGEDVVEVWRLLVGR
jgi:hypothetical protein